ncbi:hypothetical protein POM88_013157 [Heracleum sosnowskyi]|uniref:Uncharacterized protein n=1 Tax=Heracleum sosnowskyi TaxID=360622 RepID=A0AAD8IYQ1_9APIA|nr:hypothetical protein POM88_013157 [Heracleum sosnowskyi]
MDLENLPDAREVIGVRDDARQSRQSQRKRTINPLDNPLDTSILNEQSNSAAQANPDVSIPEAAPSQEVTISDSPAQDSPTKRHVDISWEKYGDAASNLGIKHPMEKLKKAGELVFSRQKKLKGSSPQEPGPQSGSAALTDDPATQEPLNQSLGEGLAIGMVTQEPFSQRENEDIFIPATQEPSSQSEDAGHATVSEKFPDNAQGISGADEVQRLVEDTINEGSTQEPPTQSVEAASEPHATQEPLVTNTDASLSNPDGITPDASGAPDAEPILIQPLRSRPLNHPITDSQDKLKGIAIPDPDVTHDTDDDDSDDSDDDNNKEKEQLARVLKSSLGTNYGSSSTFMTGKASTGKDFRQDFSVPSEIDPDEQLKFQQWENDWYKFHDSVSYPYALDHAYNDAKLIQNEDLKNHLKATTLLSKSLKHEIDSVKDSTDKVRTDISQSFTKVPTALQLRIVESQVKSIITEQSSINNRIDSLDTKDCIVVRIKMNIRTGIGIDHQDWKLIRIPTSSYIWSLVKHGSLFCRFLIRSKMSTTKYESMKIPILKISKYPTWKVKMLMYLEAMDPDYLDRIRDGPYIPTRIIERTETVPEHYVVKAKSEWTPEEKAHVSENQR